ncbi:MAG: DUF4823 domain-containing protein [Bacteroidales bacterium]|nr:DUF4823 domain-containing protein [Bacteroidales bacterium]
MKHRFPILMIICISFFVSCTPIFNIVSSDNQSFSLKNGTRILVLTAEDGAYGSQVYKGSGLMLSRKLQSVLTQYQCHVQIDLDNNRFKDLEGKDLSGYDYIIVPIITHWEDRATSWSGIPDRLSYSLFIYNNEGVMLSSTDIEAESASLTFENNDPSDLINSSLQQYFSKVFK